MTLIRDHFQNFKTYQLPKAQLIIADVPYNLGRKAHGFEINKQFHSEASKWIEENKLRVKEIKELGFARSQIEKINPCLF